MITEPAHELVFGDLLLTGDLQDTDYQFQVVGEDADTGSPEPVEQTIASLLQDGALVVTRSHGNREATFQITIEAGDAVALAEGEAALFLECSKPNLLTWTPPDGLGAASVFEVFTSSLEHAFSDMDELYLRRTYRLRLVCHPFTRSVDEVVAEALSVGVSPSTTTISDGTSATGWTDTMDVGNVVAGSGYLTFPYSYTGVDPPGSVWSGIAEATLTITATDFTATPYLSFEVAVGVGTSKSSSLPQVWADGVEVALVLAERLAGSGDRYGFLVEDASVTTLKLRIPFVQLVARGATPIAAAVRVDNIKRSNQPPGASTTGRSTLRTIDVVGSARTQGSLEVAHATGGLGDVIVYTTPQLSGDVAGYRPDLSRWQVGGSRVSDSALISGAYAGDAVFEVPVDALPAGGYALVARVRKSALGASDVALNMFWSAETEVNSVSMGSVDSSSIGATLPVSRAWQNLILPPLVLPPVSAGSDAVLAITLDSDVGSTTWEWDEIWAFYCGDDAALTMVRAGAGTASLGTIHNRLWLDSATFDVQRPGIFVGTEDDRTDAFHAGSFADAWGVHSFTPGPMLVYVANSGAANPDVSLRHFPRWFTHAVS